MVNLGGQLLDDHLSTSRTAGTQTSRAQACPSEHARPLSSALAAAAISPSPPCRSNSLFRPHERRHYQSGPVEINNCQGCAHGNSHPADRGTIQPPAHPSQVGVPRAGRRRDQARGSRENSEGCKRKQGSLKAVVNGPREKHASHEVLRQPAVTMPQRQRAAQRHDSDDQASGRRGYVLDQRVIPPPRWLTTTGPARPVLVPAAQPQRLGAPILAQSEPRAVMPPAPDRQ